MKLHYDTKTDSLYIDLIDRPSVESIEVAPGVVIDLDADGQAVGIDLDHASRVADLTRLDPGILPLRADTIGDSSE
jgi:uncharacterized protein YuzE